MPRTIVKVPDSPHFLLTDMGGWKDKAGALYLVRVVPGKKPVLKQLAAKLDLPHGLAYNPLDRFFYLGENTRISRFRVDLNKERLIEAAVVANDLPTIAKHMHPLTQFVFDPKTGDLYLNSGAPTDACFQEGKYPDRCPTENKLKMATIQRISAAKLAQVTTQHSLRTEDFEVVAHGLRNSMAMAIAPAGRFLIQGENSRDFPELEEPYEEMNLVMLKGAPKHYGWPYCFNFHGTSPEWEDVLIKDGKEFVLRAQKTGASLEFGANPFYCGRAQYKGLRDYQRPLTLIPPHAAPLHARYYDGPMFQDLLGSSLLMSWHGYRPSGQRLVAYPTNSEGLPVIQKVTGKETYGFNQPNGCPKPTPFNPRGGQRSHVAPYSEVISGWGAIKNIRPKGSPVGFEVANDGSIWIVEDKNKTLVRLARSPAANFQQDCSGDVEQAKDYNVELLAWRSALMEPTPLAQSLRAEYNTLKSGLRQTQRCLSCHSKLLSTDVTALEDEFSTLDFFVRSDWIKPGSPEKSHLYQALVGSGEVPAMPPSGYKSLTESTEGRELITLISQWITRLPGNVDQRWQQVSVPKNLNIRARPGKASQICGRFEAGDVAYIDPRSDSKVLVDGIRWSKVYLLPGHTRLVPGICTAPLDGVFYFAF